MERKFAMTKLKAGDYLLPHNDGKHVFRLATYLESDLVDATTLAPIPPKTMWGVWLWRGSPESVGIGWDGPWESCTSGLPTRQAAIEDALSYGDIR